MAFSFGDAVMAVFGVPQVHEDDALHACRAAMDDASFGRDPLTRTRQAQYLGQDYPVRPGVFTAPQATGYPSFRLVILP